MSNPAIEISGLSKFYGKARGIEDVNLEVREGEIFGFIGPNGAGKSTTIRIMLNLIFPSGGHAQIMGMDVIRETKKIREVTGYVPSDANAYPNMKVREFLAYCMRFYGTGNTKRLSELSELFELDLSRRIGDLSMGNRKKVSIIQGLIHTPRLIILDEPTNGLDPLMQSRFFDLLRLENRNGMTIFFSSHILSEIQLLCKRVAIIKDGRIIRLAEIDTLRKKQLKRITITFNDKISAENFRLEGIEKVPSGKEDNLVFMYPGDINELLQRLGGTRLEDLTIEQPSLEEIFMHYYSKTQ